MRWMVERVVNFAPGELIKDGHVHFGFHDHAGRHYLIRHQDHFLGLLGPGDRLLWTVAPRPMVDDTPNVAAQLEYPMFVDSLPEGDLIVSNFGNALLYRIDTQRMAATLLVDGHAMGMNDMGNCVVDSEGTIWINEVTGCRLWRFDQSGRVLLVLGDGQPGFDARPTAFEDVRFNWIYDIRLGADGRIHVLDSRNFALRVVDLAARRVLTIAGDGKPGIFGSDPTAEFDGPISLALDERGIAYVGDRHNHVLKAVSLADGTITTIAGRSDFDDGRANDPDERDPYCLNLPQISSLDYFAGRLYVPTDLSGGQGDLAVLARTEAGG